MFVLQIKTFHAADYYVPQQWDIRPATVGRTSYCNGTYVLPQ